MIIGAMLSPLSQRLQLPNQRKIFAIYAPTLYTVVSPDPDTDPDPDPDPDSNSSGEGQLPNPKSAILR